MKLTRWSVLLAVACVVAAGCGDDNADERTAGDRRIADTAQDESEDGGGGATKRADTPEEEREEAARVEERARQTPPEGSGGGVGTRVGEAPLGMIAADASYGDAIRVVPGVVRVGDAQGGCRVVHHAPFAESLRAQVQEDDPKIETALNDAAVAAVRCQDTIHAVVAWRSDGAVSTDEYTRTGNGPWRGTDDETWPGCGAPAVVARLWKLDRSYCDERP